MLSERAEQLLGGEVCKQFWKVWPFLASERIGTTHTHTHSLSLSHIILVHCSDVGEARRSLCFC